MLPSRKKEVRCHEMTILENDCPSGSAASPAGQTNDNEDMNEYMNVNVNVGYI
jgi:hypothetical protein